MKNIIFNWMNVNTHIKKRPKNRSLFLLKMTDLQKKTKKNTSKVEMQFFSIIFIQTSFFLYI